MISDVVHLGEGETVVRIVRRHWFHLAVVGIVDALIFLGAIVSVSVGGAILLNATVLGGESAQVFAASMFLLALIGLLLWVHFFHEWSDTWLDSWIITNKRVIDIEQRAFFRREVSNVPLERIQDVTASVSGVLATWLDFGDVIMHTASDDENFVMRQVPSPEAVKEYIVALLNARSR